METKYNIQDLFLQIKVIGQRGDGDKSDLALDAFKILQGHCSEYQYYICTMMKFSDFLVHVSHSGCLLQSVFYSYRALSIMH